MNTWEIIQIISKNKESRTQDLTKTEFKSSNKKQSDMQ